MTKMIKTSLVALSILAGASVGYAADNNNNGNMPGAFDRDQRGPSLDEREEMIDPNSTGSIETCDSGAYDEFGNCVVSPDMQ